MVMIVHNCVCKYFDLCFPLPFVHKIQKNFLVSTTGKNSTAPSPYLCMGLKILFPYGFNINAVGITDFD